MKDKMKDKAPTAQPLATPQSDADERALWQAFDHHGQDKGLDLAELSDDQLMDLAAQIDALSEGSNGADIADLADNNAEILAQLPADQLDLVLDAAPEGEVSAHSDPTLVALKNRAAGLVQAGRTKAANLGLRGWVISLSAAVSFSVAGFSTVSALAPFESSLDLTTSELNATSLWQTDSIWDLEVDI